MKFLHTSDLHIGKRIYEVSLMEDQKYILAQIHKIAVEEQADLVVIAGDLYDRAVPSTEAVTLLDDFLTGLLQAGIEVIMISGNHDSPERLSFGERILEKQGLYIAGNYQEPLKRVTMEDTYGRVTFDCMPFVKPTIAGGAVNSREAVAHMLSTVEMDKSDNHRYVLLTHFFVTGDHGEMPEIADQDLILVGGLDHVPASLFQEYSYVALGHLHKSQQMGKGKIYYSGSPLKYSFAAGSGECSVRVVELLDKGKVKVTKRLLQPLHEMRCIKGRLEDLMKEEIINADGVSREDYIQATLTNQEELIDPIGTLRSVYPNVLQIILQKNNVDMAEEYESRLSGERKGIEELFGDFYRMLTGGEMDSKRQEIVREAVQMAEKEVNP